MKSHVYATTAKCYSFRLQTQSLFDRRIAAEFNFATGTNDTVPGQTKGGMQGPGDQSRGAGETRRPGDGSIGGDVTPRNHPNCFYDPIAHAGGPLDFPSYPMPHVF
jgi:hypothetical protein